MKRPVLFIFKPEKIELVCGRIILQNYCLSATGLTQRKVKTCAVFSRFYLLRLFLFARIRIDHKPHPRRNVRSGFVYREVSRPGAARLAVPFITVSSIAVRPCHRFLPARPVRTGWERMEGISLAMRHLRLARMDTVLKPAVLIIRKEYAFRMVVIPVRFRRGGISALVTLPRAGHSPITSKSGWKVNIWGSIGTDLIQCWRKGTDHGLGTTDAISPSVFVGWRLCLSRQSFLSFW